MASYLLQVRGEEEKKIIDNYLRSLSISSPKDLEDKIKNAIN